LSGRDLVAALAPVVDEFDRLGVPYHVGGSVASSAHGIARATLDVDIVAELRPEHSHDLASRLSGGYYLDEEAVSSAIRRAESFNLVHLASMIKIDVFVPSGRPFDVEAQRRARPERLGSESSREFFVKSPEDVILAKLDWYRLGGGVSTRQWDDVLGVLKAQQPSLDLVYLRRWARELGIAEILERALSRLN
jgi:hypothetical protein